MPPKFEGKFGIPGSHETESQLTSVLYKLNEENVIQVERVLQTLTEELNERGFEFSPTRLKTLQLKIARHFQKADDQSIFDADLIDALLETPDFLDDNKGSLQKLLEIHRTKTLQKIAEIRKESTLEDKGKEDVFYENLFETTSGKHYIARLFNKAHLEKESEELKHCVGTSGHYLSEIARGGIEFFSFRDKVTNVPRFTIEYDRKKKRIRQIKGINDSNVDWSQEYDLLDAVDQLSTTIDDKGELRTFNERDREAIECLKRLREIDTKTENKENLTKEELNLLYLTNVWGFSLDIRSYPKVIRAKRNRKEDLAIIYDCSLTQIAENLSELQEERRYLFIDANHPEMLDFSGEEGEHRIRELQKFIDSVKDSYVGRIKSFIEAKGVTSYKLESSVLEQIKTLQNVGEVFKRWNVLVSSKGDLKVFPYEGAIEDVSQKTIDLVSFEPGDPLDKEQKERLSKILLRSDDAYLSPEMFDGVTFLLQRDVTVKIFDELGYRPASFAEFIAVIAVMRSSKVGGGEISTYEGGFFQGEYVIPHLHNSSDASDYTPYDNLDTHKVGSGFYPYSPTYLFIKK